MSECTLNNIFAYIIKQPRLRFSSVLFSNRLSQVLQRCVKGLDLKWLSNIYAAQILLHKQLMHLMQRKHLRHFLQSNNNIVKHYQAKSTLSF